MPRGIYPRLVRKAVPSVLIVKPERPGETERKVDVLKIPLTKERWAIIDSDMLHLTKFNWAYNITRNPQKGYAYRNWCFGGDWKNLYLHHVIIGKPINGMVVDHINGDSLDNRKENLRFVTMRQNAQNQHCAQSERKTSRFIGVSWSKTYRKWVAFARLNRKQIFLGSFEREEDASKSYRTAIGEKP